MRQELGVLGCLPVGVEVGQVRGESLRIRICGSVCVGVIAGAGDAQEIGVGDGQMREVVGVCEGGNELELESKTRVCQCWGRLLRLFGG